MMNKLFAYDGWYYRVFSFIADLILLNFLFLFSALTVVLIGPGTIALYQTLKKLYHEKDITTVKCFIQAFAAYFKQGLILEGVVVLFAAVVGLFIYGLMGVSTYFGLLGVVLVSLAGLLLTMFVLLYSLTPADSLKKSMKKTVYAVLSSTANAIVILVIPALVFILLNKIHLFLFVSVGISLLGYLQVLYFYKVMVTANESL